MSISSMRLLCFCATAFLATNGVVGNVAPDAAAIDAAFVVAAFATVGLGLSLGRKRRREPAESRGSDPLEGCLDVLGPHPSQRHRHLPPIPCAGTERAG